MWLFGVLFFFVILGLCFYDVIFGGGYFILRLIFLFIWIECVGDLVCWSSFYYVLVVLVGESYVRLIVLSLYWFDWWLFRLVIVCGVSG